MKWVVTSEQAQRQDADYPGDLAPIMERAGFAVALEAARLGAGYGSRVVVLAGAGNNGGDGYVAARHLARRGAVVTVLALGEPRTKLASDAATAWRRHGGTVRPLDHPVEADLIIDAVFGVGFHGELPAAVTAWESHPAPVVAVDVPSGLNGTTGEAALGTIAADVTVALSHYKVGHFLGAGPDVSGKVTLAELGLPPAEPTLLLCEVEDALRPPRRRVAHKWSAGSVAVVGGSEGMAGAAVLAAKAALRFGAGAVATFVPGALAAELDAAHPEIMTRGVGDGASWRGVAPAAVVAATERFDVLIVGPGLGGDCEELVAGVLDSARQPVVLDADGLNASSVDILDRRAAETVLTPHAGEFARLTGDEASYQAAMTLAATTDTVVLLKGPATIVADQGSTPWLVVSGGAELATVGSGDVLAGMIGALRARGVEGAAAARSAAYWHGEAGAAVAATSSVTAELLVEEVRRFAFETIVG
jgi:NAD(P)H-hydrate epimerase